MPKGPKGEKRPADVNARAISHCIAKISTGVMTEETKNTAAQELGRKTGIGGITVAVENRHGPAQIPRSLAS